MFCDRYLNVKVKKIQERPPRNVFNDTNADYEALLTLDIAVSVHQHNLQYLTTEIYQAKNSLNSSFMGKLLSREIYIKFKNRNALDIPIVRTT